MAPALYRDTGYALNHLVEDIRVGRIGLPDIQRPFVWSATKARDLFDSLYRGYPIGTLMFWETGAEVGTRRIGVEPADRSPQLLVVDGQQRLTALYSVITGQYILTKSFEQRRIKIAFRPSDETFEVADAAIARDPEFVADITTLWTTGYKTTVRGFLQRLAEARGGELDDDYQDVLEERIDGVRDLRDFRFQVVELGAAANEEQVAEIFVRINSEGVKLNQSDFILTLMSVHWEKGRRQLEAFSRAAVDPAVLGPVPGTRSWIQALIRCYGSASRSHSAGRGCSWCTACCAARIWRPAKSATSGAPNSSTCWPQRKTASLTCRTGTSS